MNTIIIIVTIYISIHAIVVCIKNGLLCRIMGTHKYRTSIDGVKCTRCTQILHVNKNNITSNPEYEPKSTPLQLIVDEFKANEKENVK